jgi:phosphohistidine phosphatase
MTPMEIYILRHGIAEEGKPGGRDSERRLTPSGKEKLRTVLQLARQGGVRLDLILSSPYVRAVETAEIAADELGYKGKLLTTEALTPMSGPGPVWDVIREHSDAASLLLAGHEPLLSQVVAHLLGVPALQVDMKKGALVRVDVDHFGPAPRGLLKWMLVPKLATPN